MKAFYIKLGQVPFRLKKKSKLKIPGILCLHTRFYGKERHFCGICKKDNFPRFKISFHEIFLSFSHKPQKISSFRETLCTNIKCLDAHLNFFVPDFFGILKYVFHDRCIKIYEAKHVSVLIYMRLTLILCKKGSSFWKIKRRAYFCVYLVPLCVFHQKLNPLLIWMY